MRKSKVQEIKTSKNTSNIFNFSKMAKDAVLERLATQQEGLSVEEAENRLENFGRNEISEGYKETVWSRLFDAIVNPFNIILMVVAVITFITDVLIATQKDYFTFIVIVYPSHFGRSFIKANVSKAVAELIHTENPSCLP